MEQSALPVLIWKLINGGSDQTVGMRFEGLDIPQGAIITNAYIQFTVDENSNINPCNLNIYGEKSADPGAFLNQANNISDRLPTQASVSWSPSDWLSIGDAGSAQQTVNFSSVIQEIVNQNDYTSASAIVVLINGTGARVAESFNGSASNAPELCVEYGIVPTYDCPVLLLNIGDSCDDGDACTINDVIQADCGCAGIFEDSDNDGVCDADDLCIDAPDPGMSCDDGDPCTINDFVQADCSCIGTYQDSDSDGVCDADDQCFDAPEPGMSCDDGDACTINDQVQVDCGCAGTFQDSDNDGVCDAEDQCSDGPEPGTACDDGDPNTVGESIQGDCSCGGGIAALMSTCFICNHKFR